MDFDELDAEYSGAELDEAGDRYFAMLEDDEKDRRNIERWQVRKQFHRRIALGRGRTVTDSTVRTPSARGRSPRGRRVGVGTRSTSRGSPRRSDDPEPVAARGRPVTPHMLVEDVAELVGANLRMLQARAAAGGAPHRRIPGTRRLLFLEDELHAWIDGAELETIRTPNGSRVVRPKAPA
jgi:hypothetical protein